MTSRKTYLEIMRSQLDALNTEVTQLEAGARNAKAEIRERYDNEVSKLRHQSKLADTKLEEVMVANEVNWEAMVAEMEKARDDFSYSFQYFKSNFWILTHCPQPPEVRLIAWDVHRWDRRDS